jgi:hypothetical protein
MYAIRQGGRISFRDIHGMPYPLKARLSLDSMCVTGVKPGNRNRLLNIFRQARRVAPVPGRGGQVQLVVPMTCLLTVGRAANPRVFMLPELCRECSHLHQEFRPFDINE